MELRVNGNKVDITLENEKTVGEVLKAFEEIAASNEATTVAIKLNGSQVEPDAFEKALSCPISDETLLELTVITNEEIKEAFLKSADNFEKLSKELMEVSVMLQGGKDSEVSKTIANLANEIEAFCHAATLSALFPETYRNVNIDGTDIESFFKELSPILTDFRQALADMDTVTIGDLSEYEIAPRLESLTKAIREGLND